MSRSLHQSLQTKNRKRISSSSSRVSTPTLPNRASWLDSRFWLTCRSTEAPELRCVALVIFTGYHGVLTSFFYIYKYSNHAYLRYYKKTTTFYSIKKTSNPILRTLFNLNMEGMHLSLILQLLFMRCVNTEQHLILKGVEWWCLSGGGVACVWNKHVKVRSIEKRLLCFWCDMGGSDI